MKDSEVHVRKRAISDRCRANSAAGGSNYEVTSHRFFFWSLRIPPARARTGGWPASKSPTEASELAAHRNTPPPHTSPAWPSLKSFVHASGLVSMSTTSTEASGALTLNRISFLVSFLVPESTDLPARRPEEPFGQNRGKSLPPSARSLFSGTPPRGHICFFPIPGAGAWLLALPDSLESHILAPFFRVSLRRCLRMPVWSQDTNNTLCGQVMDKWCDHAAVRGCGGARVTRHNLIRDVVHSAANDRANLATVLEKPGLLMPRDPVDDDRPLDPDPPDPSISSRRPADVWVPRGPSGGQEVWDFSTTSAFRLGLVPRPLPAFSPRLNPARTRSSTRPPSAPQQASLSALLYLRQQEENGPTVFGQWSPGSPVKANGGPVLSMAPMPASRSRRASRAPITGITRARS